MKSQKTLRPKPSPAREDSQPAADSTASRTVYSVLIAISFSHLLNDTMQSLIPATYPLVKQSLGLSFAQVGLITFVFQITASILQPVVGMVTDRRSQPYSQAVGMGFTLIGLLLLAQARHYLVVLLSVGLVGLGSAIFHPESSRVAYTAAGGRRGLAQSVFQVGGNTGSSLGPLLAALIISPYGQREILWFSLAALLAIIVLANVGRWYKRNAQAIHAARTKAEGAQRHGLPRGVVAGSVFVLLVLIFSKYFYLASLTSYYTFYLIDKFGVSVPSAQLFLFLFLLSVAAGTVIGGPIGDRFGRKLVIWASIVGSAPFALLLPHVNLVGTAILSVCVGLVLASAFPAILVYAQELLPGRVGVISGLFYGFAFGMGGIGSALLGVLADRTSITFVYEVCSLLPLLGLLTAFLPKVGGGRARPASR